jgi:hypothetical protein
MGIRSQHVIVAVEEKEDIGRKNSSFQLNAEASRIHDKNCIIKVPGKGYPAKIRDEEKGCRYRKPEQLDDSAEHDRPEQDNRKETIECGVETKKEK